MDKSIPYLLTLSSDTPGMVRFLESTGNAGNVEHIAIQFQPFTPNLKSINHEIPYPGHIEKYKFIPKNLDHDRYVIFTDTDDVVFQKPLPELTKDIYLAPENITHQYTIYKDFILKNKRFGYLIALPLFNSGCFAMKVPIFYQYVEHMIKCQKEFDTNLNQVFFNDFLYNSEFSKSIDPTIFCPIFANIQTGNLKKVNGKWMYKDELVSCVHGNGWTKEIL